jgi:hypothetical protein
LAREAVTGFNGGMLTEEALILLATLVAAGVLVLGVAELMWPAAPRRRLRRERPTDRLALPLLPSVAADDVGVVGDVRGPAVVKPAQPDADEQPLASAPTSDPPVLDTPDAGVAEEPPRAVEPAETERKPKRRASMPVRAQRVLPIETCLGMYHDRRFKEVVSLGSAALQVRARMAPVSDRPHEAAALYDLVGLSKQELGDREGARDAFVAAIHDADSSRLPTYVAHLVALAGNPADEMPDSTAPDAHVARVRALNGWVVALEEALRAVPGDETLIATLAAVREALSPACEQIVAASSAEIGQLTAQAIRSVQDGKDGEALETLERAERLAAALPAEAVAEERREELQRRLWWGYTKVGLRRCEVRNFDGAVEPLFHALQLGGIDEERAGETRAALVRALEGAVDTRWTAIEQFGVADGAALRSELEKLTAVLHSATERGLTQGDLAGAFAKLASLEQSLPRTS